MASNLGAFITQKTLMYMKERKKEKEGSTSWWQLVHELLYEGQSIC
jgi:hypothetical protein